MNTPAPASAGDDRTPVHLLTGFLGSGKTTLLRRMLADPAMADTVVVINEFGEVGLDHLLVREVAEDVVLLSSGCLCCSVRDDLVSTLADLHRMSRAGEMPRFSRAIVETTGLADPAPIMLALTSERLLTPHYRVGQVVTTVDAVNGVHTLSAHREARQQLAHADRVIVTKTDLVGEGDRQALVERLAVLNPSASVGVSGKDQTQAAVVFAERESPWQRPDAAHGEPAGHAHAHRGPGAAHLHDDAIQTFTVELPEPVDWNAFVEWLELMLASRGDSILRVKGLLGVRDDPTRPVVIQGVQHVLYPPERLAAWPQASSTGGWIVFIARDLTQASIETSLRSLNDRAFA